MIYIIILIVAVTAAFITVTLRKSAKEMDEITSDSIAKQAVIDGSSDSFEWADIGINTGQRKCKKVSIWYRLIEEGIFLKEPLALALRDEYISNKKEAMEKLIELTDKELKRNAIKIDETASSCRRKVISYLSISMPLIIVLLLTM